MPASNPKIVIDHPEKGLAEASPVCPYSLLTNGLPSMRISGQISGNLTCFNHPCARICLLIAYSGGSYAVPAAVGCTRATAGSERHPPSSGPGGAGQRGGTLRRVLRNRERIHRGCSPPAGCAASVWLTTWVAQAAQASPGSGSSLTMVPVAAVSAVRQSRCSW